MRKTGAVEECFWNSGMCIGCAKETNIFLHGDCVLFEILSKDAAMPPHSTTPFFFLLFLLLNNKSIIFLICLWQNTWHKSHSYVFFLFFKKSFKAIYNIVYSFQGQKGVKSTANDSHEGRKGIDFYCVKFQVQYESSGDVVQFFFDIIVHDDIFHVTNSLEINTVCSFSISISKSPCKKEKRS